MIDRTPTEEQQSIIGAMPQAESVMIQAYAGTGKTTTLEMAGAQVRVPALALAFNKSIATELEKRFASNFTVKTMNGLGFGAWLRANPQIAKAEIDDKKLGKLVSQVAKDRKVDLSSDQWTGLRQLVAKAMQQGIVPVEAKAEGGLVPDTEASWADAADAADVDAQDLAFFGDMPREVLLRDIELARKGKMSFDDQVYCSTMLGGKFPQFPVVFVDESQDLSPLNHRMLELGMRPDGKLVSCGDSRQAIYQFRGASADSMSRIEGLRPSWVKLPLATTFRVPKAIVARQQDHAPGFRAWDGNEVGLFASLQAPAETEDWGGWPVEDLLGLRPRPEASIAVLCRNNGPLFALAFKLIRGGTGVRMLGRDIGKGLEVLSRKLAPKDETSREAVAAAIAEWRETQSSLALAQGKDEKLDSISDKAECLYAVLSSAECRDAGQLRAMLQRLFARESGLITLSSIHKAKGLEWDLVLHLDPWRIPSKWAREAAKRGDATQLQQEWNLRYVCETRTKHTLVNANLNDFRSI